MRLSWYHDPSHGFGWLTQVKFFCYFSIYFFQFNHLIFGWYGIRLHFFFVLHSIKLSQSHYPGQGFDELIWVDLVHFFLSNSISSFNIGISYPKSQVNSCFFVLYFIYFFLNFIIQHLVVLELGFISFFFLSIRSF